MYALFLFASAYTLIEEGHVRVDVFYAGFTDKRKGLINAIGSILLGMSMCWVILIVGMDSKAAVINSPVMNFEVSQSGFGMYTKYLMAGFLGAIAFLSDQPHLGWASMAIVGACLGFLPYNFRAREPAEVFLETHLSSSSARPAGGALAPPVIEAEEGSGRVSRRQPPLDVSPRFWGL